MPSSSSSGIASTPLTQRDWRIMLVLCALGLVLFLPFLGSVHLFDWDEINFAEISREMLITGDYLRSQIDFEAFWEKPPLFFWLQTASMHVFGVNEFAARLPNALLGAVVLPALYALGKRLYDGAFGLLWAGMTLASFLPHFYFRSGIIDPLFNVCIFFAIYALSEYSQAVKRTVHCWQSRIQPTPRRRCGGYSSRACALGWRCLPKVRWDC
jgi:4-amino-4-deoxy-L-arabinose transferase-like glycosyltransferase